MRPAAPPSNLRQGGESRIDKGATSVPLAASSKPAMLAHIQDADSFGRRCKFFFVGACTRGEECSFAHSLLRTKLCKFHIAGCCTRGKECAFAHSQLAIKAKPDLWRTRICPLIFTSGGCSEGSACRFAHSKRQIRRPEKLHIASSFVSLGRTNGITPPSGQSVPTPTLHNSAQPVVRFEDSAGVIMTKGAVFRPFVLGHDQLLRENRVGDVVTKSFAVAIQNNIDWTSSNCVANGKVALVDDYQKATPRSKESEETEDSTQEGGQAGVVESSSSSAELTPMCTRNEKLDFMSFKDELPPDDYRATLQLSIKNTFFHLLSPETSPKHPRCRRRARSVECA